MKKMIKEIIEMCNYIVKNNIDKSYEVNDILKQNGFYGLNFYRTKIKESYYAKVKKVYLEIKQVYNKSLE